MIRLLCIALFIITVLTVLPFSVGAKMSYIDVDSSAWYYDSVKWCTDNGYMVGVAENTFAPEKAVTREMFITVLWAYDGSKMVKAEHNGAVFCDVEDGKWYTNAINWGVKNNSCSGLSQDRFGVGKKLTRAQMAMFFMKYAVYLGLDTSYYADLSNYTDAPKSNHWSYKAVSFAVCEKLLCGLNKTTLAPDSNAARAQIAAVLHSFDGYASENTVPEKIHTYPSFKPVLRFAVASDIHISSADSLPSENFAKMFKQAYAYADSSEYKGLDAIIVAGDLSEHAQQAEFEEYIRIAKSNIRSGTEFISVLGNHEFQKTTLTADEICEIIDAEEDVHKVIGGIHFIGVSPINEGEQAYYTKYEWLDKELSSAYSDTKGEAPIIVFQHHPQYASSNSLTKEFNGLLSKYPGVVDFSGHWHSPLSLNTVYQNKYTAVNMGTLGSYTSGVSYESSANAKYNEAQSFMIVEIDKNGSVLIRPYNIYHDRFFRTTDNTDHPDNELNFYIEKPYDLSTFTYTGTKMYSVPPFFLRHSLVEIASLTSNSVTLRLPKAMSKNGITHYVLTITDENGNTVSQRNYNGYNHLENAPDTMQKFIGGLSPSTEYTVTFSATDAAGYKTENPLTLTFVTK